jgi:hypothetical protein
MKGFFCKEVRPGSPPGFFVFRGGISAIPKRSTPGSSFQSEPLRKAQQAAPLQGLTAANFINENEKQIPRCARNDR